MTVAVRPRAALPATAHPRPAPRRAPARPSDRRGQRRLRVVDAQRVQGARRVRRLVSALSLVVVVALILAVAFHVTLAQGQLELDRLRAEATEQQARYERLRVEVAAAAAPGEIARRAHEIGLVEAAEVRYISPLPGMTDVAPDDLETTSSTLGNWPTVKPHLAEQP